MGKVAILTLLALILISMNAPVQADVTGKICVTSADTISVGGVRKGRVCQGGTRVKLHGVDGLELDQKCKHANGRDFLCGRFAASYLLERTMGRNVVCKGSTKDRLGYLWGTCFVGKTNINEMMVLEGWALVDRKTSLKYDQAEKQAKAKRTGVWSMDFVPPWVWREQKVKK